MKGYVFVSMFLVLAASSYAALTDDLIAFWDFDNDVSSTAINSIESGPNLSITGATSVAGKFGDAYDFDGNDCLQSTDANLDLSSKVTISLWQNGDAASQPQEDAIFEGDDSGGTRRINAHLPWSDSTVYWDAGSGSGSSSRISKSASTGDFEGAWNHWVFTKDSSAGNMKMYLNGNLFHSATGKSASMSTVEEFAIGSASSCDHEFYSGKVDEFAIWDRVLSASEVDDLYNLVGGLSGTSNDAAPSISDLSPVNGLTTSDVDFTFSANVSDDFKLENVSLYINNTLNQTNTSMANGIYTFEQSLAPGTYSWFIEAVDNASQVTTSQTNVLEAGFVPPPPVISDVKSMFDSTTSAIISWTTNNATNSSVEFGTTLSLGTFVGVDDSVTNHAINVTGLSDNTLYFYEVTSCESGSCATSDTQYFYQNDDDLMCNED